jgi:hypothetical protein
MSQYKKHDFRPFLNSVFIETGSYVGDGIQAALDSGFQKVFSIEIVDRFYQHCLKRFEHDPRVELRRGDSVEILPILLKWNVVEPATFWLDAHYSGGDTAWGSQRIPILKELEIIGQHEIKTHTILIDDMRAVQHGFEGDGWNDITLKQIEEAIWMINPLYRITYEFGVEPNDILIAKLD